MRRSESWVCALHESDVMFAKLEVIDNALDFLETAITHLLEFQKTTSPRELKYGLLGLSAGIELLLKQRLADEHWSLVFEDLSKASLTVLGSGDFTSVRLQDSVSRVRSVCGVEVAADHERSLLTLRRLRNKIEHFGFTVSREEGLSVAAKVWSFLLDFVHDELLSGFNAARVAKWDVIRSEMQKIERFVTERSTAIENALEKAQEDGLAVLQCPSCLNLALVINEDSRQCHYCRFSGDPRQVFEEWMSLTHGHIWDDPKERMIADLGSVVCPSCGQGFYGENPDTGGTTPPFPATICFSCGYHEPPTVECTQCGRDFTPEDWEDYPWLCEECRSEEAAPTT